MLTNVYKKGKIPPIDFYCKKCNYNTSHKQHYERHLLTAKHRNVDKILTNCCEILTDSTLLGENSSKNNIKYDCDCGKSFSYRQSLYVHKKKCNYKEMKVEKNIGENQIITKELVIQLIQQNKNLQEMLHDQHNKMFEIAKEGKIITTNNNTTNNQFNLNVFLNETCKDAINMTDFIDSLNVKLQDLEYTANTSYAEGISKIFINGLSSLNVPDRPIHCSDSKRDVIYIKDQDTWEKDDENKTKLTKAIKIVGHKNMKQIVEWQKAYPEYNNPHSKQNDRYQEMLCNAMCGSTTEETEKNYEKIIKNIAREVVIDKQAYR